MTILAFSILLVFFAYIAGLVGALTGLGGGVVIIPVLVLIFHTNIHYAMGASLISVIATSSGATIAYLREGYTNLRIGMFLEVAAVIGAFCGALLIAYLSKTWLAIIFSLALFLSAYLTATRHEDRETYNSSHPWAERLNLNSTYPTKDSKTPYYVQGAPLAFSIMGIAGMVSGLLGIGSGTLKVLAMDYVMRLPYKVSTTTSNFMIGITAAVSAGVYFSRGYINPALTFPVMIGVLMGAYSGAKLLPKINNRVLRILFSIIVCFIGLQMLYRALSGTLS